MESNIVDECAIETAVEAIKELRAHGNMMALHRVYVELVKALEEGRDKCQVMTCGCGVTMISISP